jgi:hypothetical protein
MQLGTCGTPYASFSFSVRRGRSTLFADRAAAAGPNILSPFVSMRLHFNVQGLYLGCLLHISS